MVTLKSNNEPYWICGALIFSGRQDPTWLLNEDEAQKILGIWNSLPESAGQLSVPNILGYKGCFLSSNTNTKWASFRGIVTLYKDNSPVESRTDTERKFEKAIISTAPEDAIPRAMLMEEFE